MRVGVITAIFGGYDALLQPVPQALPPGMSLDWLCFTDASLPPRVGAWRVRRGRVPAWHPRMQAKYFKIMSHAVFPGGRLARAQGGHRGPPYDVLIWIDGNLRIVDPGFVAAFVGCIGPTGWALFAHPDRNCIYAELEASLGMAKYAGLPLAGQVASYRAEGFPAGAGMTANGLIARRVGAPGLEAVNAAWWTENLRWTYQDQLSLPVVLWRLGQGYDRVPHDLWESPWFDRVAHATML